MVFGMKGSIEDYMVTFSPWEEPEEDLPSLPSWGRVVSLEPGPKISPGNSRDARPGIWACRPRHGLEG